MNSIVAIRNLLTRVSLTLILLSALAAGTFAQTVLVSDAHTSFTSANGNFGTNPILTVSANHTAYVKFEIAHALPAGTKGDDVARASVKFYVSKVATAGKLDLYPILGDWDEKTITANNAPPLGPLALTTPQINKDAQGNYLLIDITGLVKQWLGDGTGQNAVPNYGFALAPHPVDQDTPQLADINFDSKENSQTSHDSLLSVQLERGSSGLASVATDATLTGDGTTANPLGVATGAITSTHLAGGAVTAAKLADGAVTTAKIADNAVDMTKLADNAVGTTKLVDGSVGSAKIAVPLSLMGASPDFTLSVANAGTGPALTALGAINTSTQYNISGSRILSNAGANNLFAGVGAGAVNAGQSNAFFGNSAGLANVNGDFNSFFGSGAGRANTGGDNNSFFGSDAGLANTTGFQNSFFGRGAGASNTEGSFNSFFGRSTGLSNTTGFSNSFFGQDAGLFNTTGSLNTFFGNSAGQANTTGFNNTFIGAAAGAANITGSSNTLIGRFAEVGRTDLNFATAIGARAVVSRSDSVVLGAVAGINGGRDTNVGIGNIAPKTKLHITNGKVYLEANGQGMIMKSPNGSCFELTVSDAGALTITATACP
ncbi:MAG TPA: DNRLRE domain-containing protein [Blastocatellia bacterium]|nr:DNRLRE domain-containing protein [Blastocatellia bacterium]